MFRTGTIPAALILTLTPAGLSAQAPAPDLSDPEVAHVAVTANAIDIELGRLAQSRARAEPVRQFAQTMVTDHSAVNQQAAALAARLGVTPQDNAVSRSLLEGAAEARKAIEQAAGDGFDRAYVAREVAYHQAVLDALDAVLIPTSSNAELKKLLSDVRPAVAAHLEHARQLQSTLASAK
ncbi:MAG TPA: DUF4142 domain-containing protein [Gemmatimonadales bacterium]|nr:DUF4142 domain-containing protein [Gemmatimonadales bacterium]